MNNKAVFRISLGARRSQRLLLLAGVASCALVFAALPVAAVRAQDASVVPPPLAPIPAPQLPAASELPAAELPAEAPPVLPEVEAVAPALPEMPPQPAPALPEISEPSAPEVLPAADAVLPDAAAPDAAAPDVAIPDAAAESTADEVPQAVVPPVLTDKAAADAWSGTLMFDPDRMAKLYDVYQQFLMAESRKSKDGKSKTVAGYDLEKKLSDAFGQPKEIKEEVLQFSLDSIVYYTDGDWSIWVNGTRYFRDQAIEGFNVGESRLAVTDANDHEVNFIWTPIAESFDKIAKHWEDKQRLNASSGPGPQIAANERIEFDADAQTVNILLRPNQTFVSKFMSVMEGKDDRSNVAGDSKASAKDAKGAASKGTKSDAPAATAPADSSATPANAGSGGEPTLSDIQNMPDGPAKDKALANHLSNQYKKAFPGMTKAIESGSQLEQQAP